MSGVTIRRSIDKYERRLDGELRWKYAVRGYYADNGEIAVEAVLDSVGMRDIEIEVFKRRRGAKSLTIGQIEWEDIATGDVHDVP